MSATNELKRIRAIAEGVYLFVMSILVIIIVSLNILFWWPLFKYSWHYWGF